MQWEKYIDNIWFVRHEYRTLKLSVFEFSVLKLLNGSWRLRLCLFVCVVCGDTFTMILLKKIIIF